jgi:hypothetical protein
LRLKLAAGLDFNPVGWLRNQLLHTIDRDYRCFSTAGGWGSYEPVICLFMAGSEKRFAVMSSETKWKIELAGLAALLQAHRSRAHASEFLRTRIGRNQGQIQVFYRAVERPSALGVWS